MNPSNTQNPSTTEGGGLYVNAYEVSFPFGENVERPQPVYFNQSEPILEEPGCEAPSSSYSPFILISNLRTHLYVTLEKNTWLQKRILDLEEERNFLRCQLDRFISSMRNNESNDWGAESQHAVPVKLQAARSPSPPPSPMTTRSGKIQKLLQSQPLTRGRNIPVKQEVRMVEKYFEEDGYLEEEELVSDEDDSSEDQRSKRKVRGGGRVVGEEPRMKMRRVIRITHGRERQRVKDPDGVLLRYQKILHTYQRLRSMSKAFQSHGVDRNTMASTSPIAEMLLVSPQKVAEVGEFDSSKEKLLDYARRCYKALDEETHTKVQALKKTHLLLPISYRFRN
ncbi:coiled-coil domain-containing protein 106b isoform X1 [Osmerus eperlanus]|uniref:coiled-coil domain-containing protein 106b n=1 Tax=Osmerus mordax TaxID=8014 RepID=UPI002E0E194B